MKEYLYSKLNDLKNKKDRIEKEIESVLKQINSLSDFSKEDKILLFKELFIGNNDIYAKFWINKDGSKSGYSPATKSFRGKDYLPVADDVIRQHLEGKIRVGTYPIINQTMCKFLVIDLDKSTYIEDARAINTIVNRLNIKAYFEISKSGNGIHVWFFFENLVKAVDARVLGDLIITNAMDLANGIDMKSYDRMFPNQDYIAPDAFGNLIALPLHYKSRMENKTVFIDIDTLKPFYDQWEILREVKKITDSRLNNIIKNSRSNSLMPWESGVITKFIFPKRVKIVLYDAIYIEKLELSKEILNRIRLMASFYNPEFFIRQKQRLSIYNIPRVISSYEINERYIIIPRALYSKIEEFFKLGKCYINVEDKRICKKDFKYKIDISLKPEQKLAFKAIIAQEYSLLVAPPGFGKTAIASSLIAKRGVNTLILVHKTILLEQWQNRVSQYFNIDKKDVGILGKGKKNLNGVIDIATLQSIKNNSKLIKNYSQIVIDEAHHIPAVSFEQVIKKFIGKYILSLSATPKRKDKMESILYFQCGNITYEAKTKSNIKHQLKVVYTDYDTYSDNFSIMLNEIAQDSYRNQLIVTEVEKLKNRKILILSERVEHLHILYHLLKSKKLKASLLYGGMGAKFKKEQQKEIKESSIILSTSSYIGEGIDIDYLDTIFFTMPISYSERLVQYLGRIGRNNQHCIAVDFVDNNVPMLKNSFNKRAIAYKKMNYYEIKGGGLL